MAYDLNNAIQQNAEGPAEASGDSGYVKQHKLSEQIAAAFRLKNFNFEP